jgi:hypothetical protein
MKKYFYVYYSYEEFGRGYIGKRECKCPPEEDVKYFGTYRDKTFKPTQKIILEVFSSRKEAMDAEIKLHNFYQVHKNPHFANKAKATSTGFYVCMEGEDNPMTRMKGEKSPFYGRRLSAEHKEKLRQSLKNRKLSKEHRQKIGKSKIGNKNMLGKKHSEQTKKLMSEKAKGKIVSEETRKKLSEVKKGIKLTEETRQKMRLAKELNPPLGMLGKTHTEVWKKEHSERMKENNPFKGKKHTGESKKLMSERQKGRVAPNKGKPHSEETKRKISEKRKQQCELKKLQIQTGGN